MSYKINSFKTVPKLNPFSQIALPTGQKCLVTHSCFIDLSNVLRLRKVSYIPSFKFQLLSVNALTKDNNVRVIFLS